MTCPKAAIIILTKSNVDLLIEALTSIKDNCDYPDYHIYIADTGSSVAEKAEIYDMLPDPVNTTFIELPAYHFAKNNNLVVFTYLLPKTDLLLFMNNDVMWINDCLSLMADTYQRIPNIGTLGAKLLYPTNKIQHAGIYIKSYDDFIVKPGHIGNGDPNGPLFDKLYPVTGNTGALLMISKELFLKLSGFPIKYQECYEDVELSLRCLLEGKQNYYAGHASAFHLESATRNKSPEKMRRSYDDLTQQLMPFVRINWEQLSGHMVHTSHNLTKEEWSLKGSKKIYSEYMENEMVSVSPDFSDPAVMKKQITFEKRYELSSSDKKLHVLLIGHANGCGYVRMEVPAKYLNKSADIVAFPTQNITPELINWAHMFVWQAPVVFSTLDLMKTLRSTGKPQILEMDDNLLAMPLGVKTRMIVGPKETEDMLREADHLTVTMDGLGEYYKEKLPLVTPNYTVLPNCIDFETFPESKNYKIEDGIFRIGWMGGASHFEDLCVVTPALRELKKKYGDRLELNIIGWDGRLEIGEGTIDALDGLERRQTPFRSIAGYHKTLVESNLDLVFIPLAENDFNWYGKSPLKFLEASAANLPCVLSKSPVFSFVKHKETGYIVEDPLDWFTAIDGVLTDKDLRVFLAETGYKFTADNFDIKQHVDKWADCYRRIASEVYSYRINKQSDVNLP